ncbi:hypothetical protein GIB67_022991 [Kingdonia uniflora]|uniref:Uncharacterized protein n=1 Tax=Kingdonia uniflora TaxID=39325 RepID=A0A7J7P311_9MAGN|nr:hypothetical protein GIB67_022991 [Kingdonia uniflora]
MQQPKSYFEVFAVGACRRKMLGIVSYKDLYGRSVCVSGSLHLVANANRIWRDNKFILSFNLDFKEFGEIISPLIDMVLPGVGSWSEFYKLGVLGGCLSFTDCKSSKGYIVGQYIVGQYIVGLSLSVELPLCSGWAICLRENGEILLQLYYGSLISYNPESGKSKGVAGASLPFHCVVPSLTHMALVELEKAGILKFAISQVILARQFHFNYTTPDRTRDEILRTKTPLPTKHWPFICKRNGKGISCPIPHTPKVLGLRLKTGESRSSEWGSRSNGRVSIEVVQTTSRLVRTKKALFISS